jgi:signal transduction histidine kinase
MVARLELTTRLLKPQGLLLLALATTFGAEYLIMKLLPMILPAGCGVTCEAMLDACLLTLVVAPVLWLTAVRPLQRLAQSHMFFLRRALTSQEEERQRITREIHDGIGQSLTSLMLGLRALEETTGDAKTCDNAKSLREMGAGIHDELRRIVRGLRPAILDQLGLAAATLRLAEDIRNTSASTLEVDVEKLVGVRLDSELDNCRHERLPRRG